MVLARQPMGEPVCSVYSGQISTQTKSVKGPKLCDKFFHAACQGISSEVIKYIYFDKVNGLTGLAVKNLMNCKVS